MKKEKLKILYEDKYLIIVYKKSDLLTISTDKEKEKTLFHEVAEYEKKKNKNNKIFVIHRLDKDTCGLVMFAKDTKIKSIMQDNWDKVIRKYVALTYGKIDKQKGVLVDYLMESKTHQVYITKNEKLGKKAITSYELIKQKGLYNLLDIEIKTGRKHQIRVQLANAGFPIVGDKKYSDKKSPLRSLALCANYLEFNHPITGKKVIIKNDYPSNYDFFVN